MKKKNFVLFPKKLKCGETVYYYSTYDETGKRRQFSTGQKDKIEALKVCIERMSKGTLIQNTKLAFNEYTKDFFDYNKSIYIKSKLARGFKYSRNTAQKNNSFIVNKAIPYFRDKPLNMISPNDIEGFVLLLKDSGLSNATINRNLKILKLVFKEAYKNGDISHNPADKVLLFRNDTREKGIFTADEINLLFFKEDSLSKYWNNDFTDYTFNFIALTTGLRIGEIQALQKDDLETDKIIVRHSWNEKYGLGATKTGKERIVPISEKTSNSLFLIGNKSFGDFIFSKTKGITPIRRASIYKSFYSALEKIGIDESKRQERNITFHSWRHTFASILANSNMPEVQIRQLTGHSSQQVFETYTHTQFEKMREAIAACF